MKKFFLFFLLIGIFLFRDLSAFEISPTTSIILPRSPLASTILAGEELEKYIQKSTSISLMRDRKKAKNFIYIGLASDFKEIPRHLKEKLAATKADDSYICHIAGNKLFLAGKDKNTESRKD